MKPFQLLLLGALFIFTQAAFGDDFEDFLKAVKAGDVNVVQAFLDDGMNANILDARGYSAFHFAAFWGQAPIIDLFLQGNYVADINAPGFNQNTALHLAAGGGHTEVVERLLAEENLDVVVANRDGLMPYDFATGMDREAVRALLLQDSREQANAEDDGIRCGLHRAARRVYIYAVERILAYPNNDLGDREWAELYQAYEEAEAGDTLVLDILRQAGLEPSGDPIPSDSDDDGDSGELLSLGLGEVPIVLDAQRLTWLSEDIAIKLDLDSLLC